MFQSQRDSSEHLVCLSMSASTSMLTVRVLFVCARSSSMRRMVYVVSIASLVLFSFSVSLTIIRSQVHRWCELRNVICIYLPFCEWSDIGEIRMSSMDFQNWKLSMCITYNILCTVWKFQPESTLARCHNFQGANFAGTKLCTRTYSNPQQQASLQPQQSSCDLIAKAYVMFAMLNQHSIVSIPPFCTCSLK